MSDVIIIGAGITGLSCAWRLKRLGIEPLVLEAAARAGGVIQSERMGEYLIEHGPNSLLPSAENFAILDEAGLTEQLINGDPRAPRYVYVNRALRKAPLRALSARGLLRAAAEPFIRSRSPKNESVRDFFTRRIGREAHDRLVSAFVTGIYAGSTTELSMAATFPRMIELERKHGSLMLGMMKSRNSKGTRRGRTCSFPDGIETLPRRLAADTNIVYNACKVAVGKDLDVCWSGGGQRAKAVVVTAPPYHAAAILEDGLPNIARLLETVDFAPMLIAACTLADSAFPKPLQGFGFLVPRNEKLHILGTLFNSTLFPGRAPLGRQLLTSFVGGALEREAIEWPDSRVWEIVRTELQSILKTTAAPEPLKLMRRAHAIPQYRIGHEHWVESLKGELKCAPGLFLAGNYIGGVAVASCMENGERTAREVAAWLGSKQ